MRTKFFILPICFILAACSPSPEPSPTPDIEAIVAATVAVRESEIYQTRLIAPEDNATFNNPSEVELSWSWARPLAEGEHFDLRVWREGEPAYGIAWVDETSFKLTDWLLGQEAGEFLWTVAVIKGNDGVVEATIGAAAENRHFTLVNNQIPTAVPTAIPQVTDIATVPSNFRLEIFHHLVEAPTSITVLLPDAEGNLLALTIDGRIYKLRDADGDGIADEQSQILFNGEDAPVHLEWAVGMALYEDRIYISDKGRVGYLTDSDADGIFDTHEIILEGLPTLLYPLHSNNGIAFGNDGKLYLSVGATSDHGPLSHEYEASILRMNPDGSDLEVFATGFRNAYDLAFSPDGRLFTADNSPDSLDDILSFYPPEELNYVREGYDYGFPDVYGNQFILRETERETENPVALFQSSTVSTGLVYYAADAFPEEYQNGVFVSQYGGFRQSGRKIVFVPLEETEDGNYRGQWQQFLNFKGGYYPIDLTVGADGALYIVEWSQGYILRLSYPE